MYTLATMKRINQEHGFHFFDDDTMRFFQSRVTDADTTTGLFITSERREGHSRLYTIRRFIPETGDVEDVSDFQGFVNMYYARKALNTAILQELHV